MAQTEIVHDLLSKRHTFVDRFRTGMETYKDDPVALAAIRGLQERLYRGDPRNTSFWGGIHYNAEGQLEYVQAFLGDETVTVRRDVMDIPKGLFDLLASEGHIIVIKPERDQNVK